MFTKTWGLKVVIALIDGSWSLSNQCQGFTYKRNGPIGTAASCDFDDVIIA